MRMTVVQAGSQLTITASMTVAGQTVQVPALTGTINATGFFTYEAGGFSGTLNDPACGQITPTSTSLTFSGRTVRLAETSNSQRCGALQVSGTLTR